MPRRPRVALKTDLFEEAFGADALLHDLAPLCPNWIGMDVAAATVLEARARFHSTGARFLVCDARRLPMRAQSLDLVISNSTLDHFADRRDFEAAVSEIARLLRPGGRLLITVDNPRNPFYIPLRWISLWRRSPFPLGYTPSARALRVLLASNGLEVIDTGTLIHNPRGLSTVLFLVIRRVTGHYAPGLIARFLNLFEKLDRLPTRGITACFLAACAVRPGEDKTLEQAAESQEPPAVSHSPEP